RLSQHAYTLRQDLHIKNNAERPPKQRGRGHPAGFQSGKVVPDVIVNFVEAPLVCGWPGPATGWPPPTQTSTAPGTTRRIPLSSTMLRSRSRSVKLTDCEAAALRWSRWTPERVRTGAASRPGWDRKRR